MSPGQSVHAGERAATAARQELGFGDAERIPDLVATLEASGAPVFIVAMPPDIAGLARHRSGRWFLFANARHPPRRQRFTLAHEFGHAYLGHVPKLDRTRHLFITDESDDPTGGNEVTANYFAAELLLPRAAINDFLLEPDCPADALEMAVVLGARYGVSELAAVIRMRTYGILGKLEYMRARGAAEQGRAVPMRSKLGVEEVRDTIQAAHETRSYPRRPDDLRARARAAVDAELLSEDDARALTAAEE